MKKLFVLSLIAMATGLTAQKKEYDPKVMGCYKGSEVNQQVDGMSKYWISCRLEKGKSILMYVAINSEGQVSQQTENGSWWTSGGKYYELHKVDNVTDIYNYEILANGDVKFHSIELMGQKDNTYIFTDTKIQED
ncbi:hypothetical protein [Chryseobacterium sp. Mn2064]|uniref:hypothetical protein n=1 Tax=Chryseobacterium sp. Mn2064 TaxID=3395263 RepID=UPI003BC96BFD